MGGEMPGRGNAIESALFGVQVAGCAVLVKASADLLLLRNENNRIAKMVDRPSPRELLGAYEELINPNRPDLMRICPVLPQRIGNAYDIFGREALYQTSVGDPQRLSNQYVLNGQYGTLVGALLGAVLVGLLHRHIVIRNR